MRGRRITFAHPGEFDIVARVLGIPDASSRWHTPAVRERVGHEEERYCLACRQRFQLDPRRDLDCCPYCQAQASIGPAALVGESCPTCGRGEIVPIESGGWN